MRYLFGDSDLAAQRLALVAATFGPPSQRFLATVVETLGRSPRVALDLGCGPGFTTRLIADVTGARRTIGIDSSPAFVELAARRHPDLAFTEHDVTALPLPEAPADLVYCRLLLAHLPDPAAVARAWLTQVAPGGGLALDEIGWIESSHPVLQRYEELVVAASAARGAPMYAGPLLAGFDPGPGYDAPVVTETTFPVATADAARMFAMNFQVWRTDPAVAPLLAPGEGDALQRDLDDLATADGSAITWGLSQMLVTRHP